MSSTPRHLPNKRHIGKQDPYCTVTFNGEKRRTKALKKGGQHPEWDEEVRFTLYEDLDDDFEIVPHPDGSPPPPPPKDPKKGPKKIKGGSSMKLTCFADDPREPDLIGETVVDLTEVLTKGETDEWFTLMHREKFAGEVYLELTFWSNEPVPEKKSSRKNQSTSHNYGGTGVFVPYSEGTSTPPESHNNSPSRMASMAILDHPRQSSGSIASTLRSSNSLAQLDLYVPPYESRNRASPIDRIAQDMGELGVSEPRRRESLPVPPGSHITHRWPTTGPALPTSNEAYAGQNEDTFTSDIYSANRAVTPSYQNGPGYDQHDPRSIPSAPYTPKPSVRSSRYSFPMTSSGFMPIASRPPETPAPVSHTPANFTHRVSSGFMPTSASTPALSSFAPPMHPSSTGFPSQTPIPQSSSTPYLSQIHQPPPVSTSFPPHPSLPQSHSYQYHAPYPSSQPYNSTPPPVPLHTHSAPPTQSHQTQSFTSSPTHDNLVLSNGTGSRPLPPQPTGPPQPQLYTQQSEHHYAQPSQNHEPQYEYYDSSQPPNQPLYQSVPPPPPLPPSTSENDGQGHPSSILGSSIPPPPPLNHLRPRRQSSLPQPPVNARPPPGLPITYQSIPPPPPPSLDHFQTPHSSLPPPPSNFSQYRASSPYYNAPPPPRPPVQYDDQGQWVYGA